MKYIIKRIDKTSGMAERAAKWFHEKWDNPEEMYSESISASLAGVGVLPKWYLVLNGDEIIGGAGVIGEASVPDLCAVYVENDYRGQGIAGRLLEFICEDMAAEGLKTLYLITEFNTFYEKYGWEFMTVIEEDEGKGIRLYRHQQ